jgi:hypothetical protein
MKHKFKPGDIIILKRNFDYLEKGDIGIVLEDDEFPFIKWNKYNINNHDCGGLCKTGYGYSVDEFLLELYKEQEINYEIY